MSKKYITLVFEHDENNIEEVRKMAQMESCRAWSLDHEINRLGWYELAEDEINDLDDLKDVLRNIATCPDIMAIKSLDDLRR